MSEERFELPLHLAIAVIFDQITCGCLTVASIKGVDAAIRQLLHHLDGARGCGGPLEALGASIEGVRHLARRAGFDAERTEKPIVEAGYFSCRVGFWR